MKTKKDIKSSENIKMYCSNRNCSHLECVRHDKNIPFNVLIKRENYDVSHLEYLLEGVKLKIKK